ncbi:MAG: D-glycero-beta-D-manno-heptose 1-phosphate adenylyltransferase [Ignavibacteria bacterium]|jgi:D-beta-D-heptose 7-phosphate kinase/D-beta-D-heptose 1-phosphate adenosyltransferase|nr:D-glycero-beta-D-manno-heptose 1-phosphate adenylyltransferase [Ignavibacteria bacterium]MDH7528846.1 D-glycero-beta-D-manno-heptose 1-phosphate adenylyltransferase [Ignavibacteria bacterium]
MKTLLSLEEFLEIRKKLKVEGKKLVFTNGCFDIIHRGHIDYLNRAKALGDYLVVALNSDESVRRLKGEGRPINKLEDRAFVIANLKAVDFVVSFDEDTPFEIISAIIPDVLVKGGDWSIENIVGRDIVEANGGKVYSLPYVENYSTTNIINKMKNSGSQD